MDRRGFRRRFNELHIQWSQTGRVSAEMTTTRPLPRKMFLRGWAATRVPTPVPGALTPIPDQMTPVAGIAVQQERSGDALHGTITIPEGLARIYVQDGTTRSLRPRNAIGTD
jgi:hypothetical protein